MMRSGTGSGRNPTVRMGQTSWGPPRFSRDHAKRGARNGSVLCESAETLFGHRRRQLLAILALPFALWVCWPGIPAAAQTDLGVFSAEANDLEVKSGFSRIIVRTDGDVRSLIFVHDDGLEGLESEVDLSKPYHLRLPYTRYMFASYLLRPKPKHVLLVGLGGGAMVHFLRHYDADLQVDVVEIDPIVVKIADVYFGVRSGGKVRIILNDASKYLTTTRQRYDVIYMDAFLKPSANTDISGVPARLKTARFLKSVQERLEPGGLVVFNVHIYDDTKETLATIRSAFPQVYVFEVSHRQSLAVVGSLAKDREKPTDLRLRARQLDRRFQADFSFQELVKGLKPDQGEGARAEGDGRNAEP
jgi:spermidine synthase